MWEVGSSTSAWDYAGIFGGLAQAVQSTCFLQAGGQRFEIRYSSTRPRGGHAIIDMLDRQNVKKANDVCFNEHVQAGPPPYLPWWKAGGGRGESIQGRTADA